MSNRELTEDEKNIIDTKCLSLFNTLSTRVQADIFRRGLKELCSNISDNQSDILIDALKGESRALEFYKAYGIGEELTEFITEKFAKEKEKNK